MIKIAKELLKDMSDRGLQAYIVGGAVRDLKEGVEPSDVDIVVEAPSPDELPWPSTPVHTSSGEDVRILEYKGESFETTFSNNILVNVKSRDFTINSLLLTSDDTIKDVTGGLRDLSSRQLRCNGVPVERFKEDPLRILRGIRLAAKMSLDVEHPTEMAMIRHGAILHDMPPERIQRELYKMSATGSLLGECITSMLNYGVLGYILPEILRMVPFPHSNERHPEGGVFLHTLEALEQSESRSSIGNLAVALHDCGKPYSFQIRGGHITYNGHESKAVEVLRNFGERLKISKDHERKLAFCASNHTRVMSLQKVSKMIPLVNSDHWKDLKNVVIADQMARAGVTLAERRSMKTAVGSCLDAIEHKANQWIETKGQENWPISGHRIMKVGGIEEGTLVGDVKEEVNSWVVDQNIRDEEQIDKMIRQSVRRLS
jgi:tRNA nucleotidyltransferase/poly(A) polymerase